MHAHVHVLQCIHVLGKIVHMATKAELQAQLEQAQAQIEQLQAQEQAKPVTVTVRVPLALREDMKAASRKDGVSMQVWMVSAFSTALQAQG